MRAIQKTTFFAAGLMMLSPQAFAGDMDAKWTACAADSDCILVKGFCNYPTAINKKYQDEFGHWLSGQAWAACPKPPETSPPVACIEHQCVAGKV